jgi:hypothetical protein
MRYRYVEVLGSEHKISALLTARNGVPESRAEQDFLWVATMGATIHQCRSDWKSR